MSGTAILARLSDKQEAERATSVTDAMFFAEFMPKVIASLVRIGAEIQGGRSLSWAYHSMDIPLSATFSNGVTYLEYFRKRPQQLKRVKDIARRHRLSIASSDVPSAPYGNNNPYLECRLIANRTEAETHWRMYIALLVLAAALFFLTR